MTQYLIRRLMLAALTLFLITFLVYGLVRSIPGDPALMRTSQTTDTSKKFDEKAYQQYRKQFGLDRPWYIAYFTWLGDAVSGNLQQSFSEERPVTEAIGDRIGNTLVLTVSSLLLAYMLSIPLGLRFAVKSGGLEERGISAVLYMLYSLPSYVAALFLQLLFAVKLGWLPLFGTHNTERWSGMSTLEQAWDILLHAILPVTCYTYAGLAYYARFIKANMNEVMRQDYIRTARAKGVGPVRVVIHHAFRNTLIPLVTQIGLTLPALLGGSVILEQIFNWPGIGQLFLLSLKRLDYPVVMGLVLMFSVLTLLGQLLADVLYAVVDPRVSLN